jgi:mediator of RNA polymerase II transcription subunit 10
MSHFNGMASRQLQGTDSPRSSQSPAPSGVQGDLELELLGLANSLYNLGTTVINDSTKERDKSGGAKQVGLRVYVAKSMLEHYFFLSIR